MNIFLIKNFIFVASFVLSIRANENVCNTSGCKTLSNDLLHQSMDLTANPCEDFNQYVCGNWPKSHSVHSSSGRQSYFNIINNHVIETVSNAMNDSTRRSKSHVVKYVSDIFNECNNIDLREKRGTKPLVDLIENIVGGWPAMGKTNKNKLDWQGIYTNVVTKAGITPVFRFAVQYNYNIMKKLLFLLPESSAAPTEILVQPGIYSKQIEAYKKFMHDALIMMGAKNDDDLKENVEQIYNFEKKLATYSLVPSMARLDTFKRIAMNFDNTNINFMKIINNILKGLNSTQDAFVENDPIVTVKMEYLNDIARIFEKTPINLVQNYFAWILTFVYGPSTTQQFRHAKANYAAKLNGIINEPPNMAYCSALINSKLPFAYSRVYVDSSFTKADKDETTLMVKELKKSFKTILLNNKWLDEETKAYALKKLEKIKENIAYPEWLIDDADLDNYYESFYYSNVIKDKFIESLLNMYARSIAKEFNEFSTPYNHTRAWPMTPATVNAAYMPIENSITIPAAILNSPFFDRDRPLSMNYGSIGAIIGHELTHGFDNNGRSFDAYGKQANWWSDETNQDFLVHAKCFIDQYGAIHDDFADKNINGALTLGENIADNGGLKEAWYAYQAHQKIKPSTSLPNMKHTSDQLFFISFARNWCSIIDKQTLIMQILTNPHTPDKYRTLVVLKNSLEFAASFKCAKNSTMNPIKKCAVW